MTLAIDISYLIAAVLFIVGIKQLTKVKTAKRGNALSSLAMLIAVIVTLLSMDAIGWPFIIAGVAVGGLIGVILAKKVQMTSMPELVAVFNGFGGGASVLVALSYLIATGNLATLDLITVELSLVIGAVTFTGSIVAFSKLKGIIKSRPIVFPGSNTLKVVVLLVVLGFAAKIVFNGGVLLDAYSMVAIAAFLGILLVISIGGADMPVVVSLLNSYSGLAAAATGFVLKNMLLIVSGALVGASGLILTQIMCKAMNRSLSNVLFGGFGAVAEDKKASGYKSIKESSPEEAALLLESADSAIIVPGYGLAVAQAQFAAQELTELLEKRGCKVTYAIHPVAGRMPGHMNVLLAEANVPYDKLLDLDQINNEFKNTDVVIIAGANDVVNPAATNDKNSPIYGMPILKAHEARTVLVIKRSLSPGFAGIDNELFDYDNTRMILMDAKAALQQMVQEVEELE